MSVQSIDELSPSLNEFALFLDIDGTLIDLADTPDAVVVPDGLGAALAALGSRLGGALALITGRSVQKVESLFPGLGLHVAGLHGTEVREPGGQIHQTLLTPEYEAARDLIAQALRTMPGALFEDKGSAFAAHFRLAPAREDEISALMATAAGMAPGWRLQPGKSVIELRPAGGDKGVALTSFMSRPPFLGRRPVAIGDDVTDEAMFAASRALGGLAFLIGDRRAGCTVSGTVASPCDLRDWIERMAA